MKSEQRNIEQFGIDRLTENNRVERLHEPLETATSYRDVCQQAIMSTVRQFANKHIPLSYE